MPKTKDDIETRDDETLPAPAPALAPAPVEPLTIADAGIRLPSVDKMREAWDEHIARQDEFKRLILSRLVPGRHYGFPPGCDVKYDANGNVLQWSKKANKGRGGWTTVPKEQWQAKPSLYVEGALELRDLFKLLGYPVRCEYEELHNDGKTVISKCVLIHEVTGQRVGEGKGSYAVGVKGADLNTAIQMADNRAMKAAIRRTLPCVAGLFTQDREDAVPAPQGAEETGFGELVQEWVAEETKGTPLEDHEVSEQELKTLRAHIKIWCAEHIPESAADAVEWLRQNVSVGARENKEGVVMGVLFRLGKPAEDEEQEELPM